MTMKRRLIFVALSALLLSTAAFAQSTGEKTGVNSVLGIAPKTADFIKEAAMSDMLEIDAAKLAEQKGNAAEKTFAAQMIADHTKTSAELKGMVSGDLKAAIPTALDDSSQKKLDKLKNAKPEDFASSTIRCRLAPTRTPSRSLSATPRAAMIRSSRIGPVKHCRRFSTTLRWRRT
jgi:putative membrane protein